MDQVLGMVHLANIMCNSILDSSDEDYDVSDEEEYLENMLNRKPSRIFGFLEITVSNSSNKEFQSHFRVTRPTFEMLLHLIEPDLKSRRLSGCGRQTINPEKQLLCVLWLLATPDSYRSIGNRFDMGKSSLFSCFLRVIKALNNLSPRIIKWPNHQEAQRIEEAFSQMAGIRGVVGAIDGTYIRIKAPRHNPEAYINRKCFHGVTLQAICDNSLRFTDCYAGWPSSVSDIRISKNSDIYADFQSNPDGYFGQNNFIIGDKAYPIKKWCIPPYIQHRPLLEHEKKFNTAHAKTRQVVERSFALLFGRFRRLQYLDMNRTDLIPATIIAACVLHNICLNNNDEELNIYEQEGAPFVHGPNDIAGAVEATENVGINEGKAKRNTIAVNLL